jgi:hypothetical protein
MSRLNVNTIYPRTGDEIAVSGNLNVSGTFKAYQFETIVHNSTTYLGSSTFGNDSADNHYFNGDISGSGEAIFVAGITTAGDLNVSGTVSISEMSSSGKGIFVGGVEAVGDVQTSGSLLTKKGLVLEGTNAKELLILTASHLHGNIPGAGAGDVVFRTGLDSSQATTSDIIFASGTEAQFKIDVSAIEFRALGDHKIGWGDTANANYIQLDTNLKMIATANLKFDAGGGESAFLKGGTELLVMSGGLGADDFTLSASYADQNLALVAAKNLKFDASDGEFTFHKGGTELFVLSGGLGSESFVLSASEGSQGLSLASAHGITLDVDSGGIFFNDSGVQHGVLKMDTSNKFILSSSVSLNDFWLMSGKDVIADAAADIHLDADGGEVFFKDGGAQKGVLKMDTSNKFILSSSVSINDFHLISGKDIVLEAAGGDVLPHSDNVTSLGSSAKRWANVYTADLHLKNDRGDWTIVEETDYLSVVNNKTNKTYKIMLEEIKD